ncbi:MAG: thiopurine S-methyltransferase [Pseudomonadota bacterium]
MEHAFWHERWEANQIGFHQAQVNALLADNLTALNLSPGARVFVPLCGKTLDIAWLRDQGLRVAGAELSRLAVEQLFEGMSLTPEATEIGPLTLLSAGGVDIFVGDIFDLDAATLGAVDAVYDRAALVALPPEMRTLYAQHVPTITNGAPQLLIAFTYDQSIMDGPPFSVPEDEIRTHYGERFQLEAIASRPVEGGLKGIAPADATMWFLR